MVSTAYSRSIDEQEKSDETQYVHLASPAIHIIGSRGVRREASSYKDRGCDQGSYRDQASHAHGNANPVGQPSAGDGDGCATGSDRHVTVAPRGPVGDFYAGPAAVVGEQPSIVRTHRNASG